jgi:hypothetical protein
MSSYNRERRVGKDVKGNCPGLNSGSRESEENHGSPQYDGVTDGDSRWKLPDMLEFMLFESLSIQSSFAEERGFIWRPSPSVCVGPGVND